MNKIGYQAKAGLKITSTPEAAVLVNGEEVGKTPYEDSNLLVGEYLIKLTTDKAVWQSKVRLTKGTVAVINRDMGESIASSSGEILSLDRGTGVFVTSTPEGAGVEIDGRQYGRTPVLAADLKPGEHTFLLSHDGYLKRSIKATLPEDLALNLDVSLAIAEMDLGSFTLPKEEAVTKLRVKQTPTGFLRVRDDPSTKGVEVGRASVGDNLTLIEELPGWYKVRMEDGTEGYVSAAYIQKQS